LLGRATAVDLRARGRQQVEARRLEAAQVGERVGARGDGLRLQGFEFGEGAGRKLVRDDAAQVVF
jgi:hypothetical protein